MSDFDVILARKLAHRAAVTCPEALSKACERIEALEARCQRYREALEFYAGAGYERILVDRLGYFEDDGYWIWDEPEILEDGGAKAREALRETDG